MAAKVEVEPHGAHSWQKHWERDIENGWLSATKWAYRSEEAEQKISWSF